MTQNLNLSASPGIDGQNITRSAWRGERGQIDSQPSFPTEPVLLSFRFKFHIKRKYTLKNLTQNYPNISE